MRVPRFISVDGFIANQDFLSHPQENKTGVDQVVGDPARYALPNVAPLKRVARFLITNLTLPAADMFTLLVAVVLSTVVCGGSAVGFECLITSGLLAVVMFVSFATLGLYPGIGLTPAVELRLTLIVVSIVLAAFGAASFAARQTPWVTLNVGLMWAFLVIALPVARGVMRTVLSRFSWWGAPTIVFGSGETGVSIYHSLCNNPSWGLRPIGIVDEEIISPRAEDAYRGSRSDIKKLVKEYGVSWCIVAIPDRPREEVLRLVDSYAGLIPNSLIVPDLAGLPSLWTGAADCGGFPGLRLKERLLMPIPKLAKRIMDAVLTVAICILLSPLLVLLAVLVKLSSKGPIFYSQKRLGLNGKPFRAWKFRTMVPDADKVLEEYLANNEELRAEWEKDHKLKNDPRVTTIGNFLRKTSLDELPQVWNVLCGEMSLVGPRPIVDAEIVKYGKSYDLYLRVRPGITGLWQVSGRNNTTYEQRVQLDGYYVRNWSPWLDLCILLVTIRVVLLREGAY